MVTAVQRLDSQARARLRRAFNARYGTLGTAPADVSAAAAAPLATTAQHSMAASARAGLKVDRSCRKAAGRARVPHLLRAAP